VARSDESMVPKAVSPGTIHLLATTFDGTTSALAVALTLVEEARAHLTIFVAQLILATGNSGIGHVRQNGSQVTSMPVDCARLPTIFPAANTKS
jgi:hypothetical protein